MNSILVVLLLFGIILLGPRILIAFEKPKPKNFNKRNANQNKIPEELLTIYTKITKPVTEPKKTEEAPPFNKIEIINKAIINGYKIRFEYKHSEDYSDGEKSDRTIKPTNLIKVGRSLCVVGYCYLRKAERTFAISRINNLNTILPNKDD